MRKRTGGVVNQREGVWGADGAPIFHCLLSNDAKSNNSILYGRNRWRSIPIQANPEKKSPAPGREKITACRLIRSDQSISACCIDIYGLALALLSWPAGKNSHEGVCVSALKPCCNGIMWCNKRKWVKSMSAELLSSYRCGRII